MIRNTIREVLDHWENYPDLLPQCGLLESYENYLAHDCLLSHRTAIRLAARYGYQDLLNELIDRSIESREFGQGVVHDTLWSAAYGGYLDVIIGIIDTYHPSTLYAAYDGAARGNHLNIIDYLLDMARDENNDLKQRYIDTALVGAAQGGHLDLVRKLIDEYGARDLRQALADAVSSGHLSVVRELLNRGTHIFTVDDFDIALPKAVHANEPGIVRDLIIRARDFGMEPNFEALILDAAHSGYLDVVKQLIEAGAGTNDPYLIQLAISQARRGQHPEIIQYLQSTIRQ